MSPSPRPKITTQSKQKPLSKYQQALRGLNQKGDGTLLGKMKILGVQQQVFRSKDGKRVFYRDKNGEEKLFVSGGKAGVDNWLKRNQSSGRLDQSKTAMAEEPKRPLGRGEIRQQDEKRRAEQQQQQQPKPQSALANMRDTVQKSAPAQPDANVTKPAAENAGTNQAGRPQEQAEDPRRQQMIDAVAKQQGTGAYANKPKPQGMTPAQKDALDRRNQGGGGGETTGEEDTGEMPVGVGGGRQRGGRDSLPPNLSPHVMDGFGGGRQQVEPVGTGGISPIMQNPGGGLLPGGGGTNVDTGGLSSGAGNRNFSGFLPAAGNSGASGPNNVSWWNPVGDLPTFPGGVPYYGPRLPWGELAGKTPI